MTRNAIELMGLTDTALEQVNSLTGEISRPRKRQLSVFIALAVIGALQIAAILAQLLN